MSIFRCHCRGRIFDDYIFTENDRKAGILWDKKVLLGDKDNPKGPFRLILIRAWDRELLILTNKWDIPAEDAERLLNDYPELKKQGLSSEEILAEFEKEGGELDQNIADAIASFEEEDAPTDNHRAGRLDRKSGAGNTLAQKLNKGRKRWEQ